METSAVSEIKRTSLSKAFWVIWAVELWERFGYYGVQAILALYFVQQLGYTEAQSFYVFGIFSSFVYGFVWLGGWVGDQYLGSRRTLILGAVILTGSYVALALANHNTIFYALAAIVVGNSLFKANPSSIISKMYQKGDPALDGAMTLYYMAVNVGSMISMAITPIIAANYSWALSFWICTLGLIIGLGNFLFYQRFLFPLSTGPERHPLNYKRLLFVILGSLLSIAVIANLLSHTTLSNWIIYIIVFGALLYYLKIAISLTSRERTRMLIAFILIIQAVLFFVLYNQMPTSLTFFAVHNVNNHILGFSIPPAEYQVLNSIVIVIMSPILVWFYKNFPSTHVTKFCIGMTLASLAFLVLALPQYISTNGLASPLWLVASYYFQSVGELFISGLGLAMVAELCPEDRSGFVMGIWFLTVMLAGPIGAWVGSLTTPPESIHLSTIASMQLYCHVFFNIGLVTLAASVLMWLKRPLLNRYIQN